ncbi:MAG: hypothetical protein ABUL58_01455 [Steroidobacter sp.]
MNRAFAPTPSTLPLAVTSPASNDNTPAVDDPADDDDPDDRDEDEDEDVADDAEEDEVVPDGKLVLWPPPPPQAAKIIVATHNTKRLIFLISKPSIDPMNEIISFNNH